MARDAIQTVGRDRAGCGLLDLDFLAGFDWLDMGWVYAVLEQKGVISEVVERIKRLYADSVSIVVVNNVMGICTKRQGFFTQGGHPEHFLVWCWLGPPPRVPAEEAEGHPHHFPPCAGTHSPPPCPPSSPLSLSTTRWWLMLTT